MPHEAYHQALMLVEIVDKLQKENCQQKLTIKRMEDELGGIALDNTGSGSHEPQPTSMSPKSDFIASLFDDQGSTDPETLKTFGRWILDTGVSIPERTQPRSHQEVQAQLLKEAKQRGDDLRAIAEARELRCLDLEKTLALREEQVLDLTHKNKEFKKYADKLVAHAIESPSHEAQKKIILALRRDNKILREQLAAEHLRSQACEKQIMIDTRERNEANRTIADQKCLIVKYRKRLWFVTRKLLLAEQRTHLQSYIDSEE